MLSVRSRRLPAFIAAFSVLAALAGCNTPAPPPPPPPAPPPAPAPAAFSLSPAVIQTAAAYQAYMTRTAAMKPDFKSGDDVADRLKQAESYDPVALTRGEIAFAAIAALQNADFVAEVRGFSVDPAGRRQMINTIASDPNYVTAFKTMGGAAGMAIAALTAQGQDLEAAGSAIKQSAYDLQHQAWSTGMVAHRDERLLLAKAVSTSTPPASIDDTTRLQQAATGAAPLGLIPAPAPAAGPYPPAVVRGVAIAALAVLGAAGDENAALTAPLLSDPPDETCLSMAKLNLYQCLAVSKPHYEDIFCLGQHVMMDTGQCVRIAAGAAPPAVEALPPAKTETAYGAKPKVLKKKHKAAT